MARLETDQGRRGRQRTGPKFFRTPAEVAERKDLTLAAKVVYGEIVTRVGKNGHCWPSMATIARDWGLSVSAVKLAIAALRKTGLITIESRPKPRSNVYRLNGSEIDRSAEPPIGQKLTIDGSENDRLDRSKSDHEKKRLKEKVKQPPLPPARAGDGDSLARKRKPRDRNGVAQNVGPSLS